MPKCLAAGMDYSLAAGMDYSISVWIVVAFTSKQGHVYIYLWNWLIVSSYKKFKQIRIQYSSGKRTKKLFIPNIGVSRTCQKHSESNRVNVIFGGHHSQVRRMYTLCEVMRSYSEWKYYTPEAIFLAKRCEIPRSNLTKYLSDFYIFIYLFNKVI